MMRFRLFLGWPYLALVPFVLNWGIITWAMREAFPRMRWSVFATGASLFVSSIAIATILFVYVDNQLARIVRLVVGAVLGAFLFIFFAIPIESSSQYDGPSPPFWILPMWMGAISGLTIAICRNRSKGQSPGRLPNPTGIQFLPQSRIQNLSQRDSMTRSNRVVAPSPSALGALVGFTAVWAFVMLVGLNTVYETGSFLSQLSPRNKYQGMHALLMLALLFLLGPIGGMVGGLFGSIVSETILGMRGSYSARNHESAHH